MNTPVLTPATANPVKTSTAQSPPAPPAHHGKKNTGADEITLVGSGGNTKKRKANSRSAKPKQKHPKVMADTDAAQEYGISGENCMAETAPTHSGHRSNLPSRFKDAGYPPPKRNVQKKDV
jgi:hypothetical protein